ncbi:MAG: Phytochrome-like protein cph2 [bacterium ADurb.Bin429]|nr:MAG: Phytochrome-like protein cph2 [bacterium ADurb.Bin429]
MARSPARWQPALAVTLVFSLIIGLLQILSPARVAPVITLGAQLAAALIALAWILPQLRFFTLRQDRLTWLLVAASIFTLLVASWAQIATHTGNPFMSGLWIQVAMLTSYGLLWLGILGRSGLLPRDTVSRLVSICDILVAIGAAIILTSDLSPANARMLGLPYLTAARLALVTLICLIFMLHKSIPRALQSPRALMGLSIGLVIAKDMGLGASLLSGFSVSGSLIALLGPIGIMLFGVAARWEAATDFELTQPEREIDPLPSLAGMLVPTVMVIAAMVVAAQAGSQAVLFSMTMLILLVMARQIVTFEKDRHHYQELQELYAISAREATTDPLTGMANQRHFCDRLDVELRRARRYRRTLALIFADLDHFKSINDTYGHHVGDVALKMVATCLARLVRETDLVVRYGGEEFVVMLPETTLEQAEVMAERLRRAVEQLQIPLPQGGHKRVTMSFGVAAFPETAETPEDLLTSADAAMYHAKALGRNRVMVAVGPTEGVSAN